jgi:amino acid adenylation domain-containing protein
VEGDLDRRALWRALASTVARHEILRTALRLRAGLSMPLQVILEPGPVSLAEIDLRDLSQEHRSAGATALLHDLGGPPFDLERGEGWRVALVRLGPGEHEILFALSATCADPGAFEPLATDLLAAYARQVAGREDDSEPPLQYADVAEWQNSLLEGEDAAEGIETWREHWRGHDIDTRIALPLPLQESEAEPGPFAPRDVPVPLGQVTAGALARLAGLWGCPLPVLILTAWKALLQRGTGRDETLVGVLYAGRDAEELQRVIGPLARYLPIAARFSPDSPLREAVAEVQQAMKKAVSWGEYFSWDHVGGNGHGAGGFPVCFEAGAKDWTLAVDSVRAAPVRRSWNSAVLDSFSLALSCAGDGERLQLALRYDPRRFRRDAARRLAGRLAALLGSVAARPEDSLADHPAMPEDELGRWLELAVAPPAAGRGREGKTLSAVFEEQVDRAPDRLAVVAGDRRLTFRELDAQSNRLAHHLRAAGAGPEVPVALCLERSAEAVVALLAVWKAGAAYVPLDPTQPAGRLAWLLEDTGAPLLVTDSHLPPVSGARTMRLDEEAAAIARRPADRPAGQAGPRNLAYVIYTSGSTGRPKGVQVEHRSALHLLAALEAAVLDPLVPSGRRPAPLLASLNAPMIFDASVQQLALLLAGHALCVVPQDIRADGAALLAFLREQGVDLLDCTPSQLRLLVAAGLLDGPAGPRLVLTAGEAVDEPLWRRLAQAERTVCFNLDGPTECSVDATFHRVEPGSSRPTIGRPLPGYEVFLLDHAQRPVPPGAQGELCLGGAGLARGYLGRPGLTAERFVPHPFARRPGERLYRTGDLGRHLPNGDLEFLGRLDHQVKIRGFRIELGEIEAALVEQAGVRDAVVVAQESATEDRRLVAYVAGEAPVDALRQALRQRLPDYMMPATFVTLAALPLTPSGKVDRKALPAPERRSAEESHVAPRTPVEEILAGIWAELLGVERVGAADHFFDLGGHSLLATRVISRLRSAFDVAMPLRALFEAPVLADLAARIEAALRAGARPSTPPLVPVPRQGPLPLSFAQQRLWFLDQLEPASPLYNIAVALRAEGPLDTRVLALCLGEIVRRHAALRTVFAAPEGSPVQVIQPAAPFGLAVVDLSGLPEGRREAQALSLAAEEAGRPFDPTRGPLLRGALVRLNGEDHVATLTMHHIISDGWSMSILVREVTALYAAFAGARPSPLPELPVQYADFCAWQRSWLHGEVLESEISFWRRQLQDLPPRLELSTDRPRPPVQSFRGASRPMRLPAELTRRAQELSRSEGATIFMVLLAGFQALLARCSGQQDLAVGTPVAGRNQVEVEGLVGFFVNTLVLRGDLTGGRTTFRELVGRVRETALAAYLHQDVPFEKLVEELAPERSLAHAPLFQVMLVLQNAPAEVLEVQDLRLRPVGRAGTTAKFDLTLGLVETADGEMRGAAEYATDLFDAVTIDRLILHSERLLTAALAAPELPAAELPLLSPAERHQATAEWNDTAVPPARELLLHDLLADRAAQTPELPALVQGNERLTHGELNALSERLAAHLRASGVGPDVIVALFLERSIDLVVALLAVLKAGGAYLPLETTLPRPRLSFMLDDACAPFLLTRTRLLPALPEHSARVVCLDDLPESPSGEPPAVQPAADNLAYVLYTSGSTGTPKGVAVTHRGLASYLLSAADLYPAHVGRGAPVHSPISFDLTVTSLFLPLLAGLCAVLVPEEEGIEGLAAALAEGGFGLVKLTPAHLDLLQRMLPSERVPGCASAFVVGGEPLTGEQLAFWRAHAPGLRLFNEYGPTETVVGCCVHEIPASQVPMGPVSIGRPIANTRIQILDPRLWPVPIGVCGELHIGGAGVCRGYLRRPDLTAEKLVPDPFGPGERLYRTGDLARYLPDGTIELLGRSDHQVKVRGFRIELGEIEALLVSLPGIREAVVVAREDTPGDRRLVAYVVGDVAPAALRQGLRERLPVYMLPAAFVMLAALPLTPNGKVDRKALPAPEPQGGEDGHLAPRSPVEEILAGIWSEVLGRDRIGANDHFFHLGGHSLLATQVMSRLRKALDVEMPLRELFEAPTLADLATRITAARWTGARQRTPSLFPVRRQGPPPLSFAQQRLWFIDQLEPASPLYNIPVALRVAGPLRPEVLALCLGEIVRRHETLRTVFATAEGAPVQAIRPAHSFGLPVVDLAGLPEREREASALTLTRAEAARPFDLERGPLLRGVLLRLGRGDHIVALTMHHIISDGWSMGILVREVTALYAAFAEGRPSPLPELPLQYADFAAWQRSWLQGEVLEGEISFWRRQLAGLPPRLELPTDRSRPAVQSFRGAARPVRLPAELGRQAVALSRREGATLFMVLLAGFQALLARYSGQHDLAVGSPVAGRNWTELEGLIGFFINTLVLRGDLSGEPSFRELLGRVRETALAAHAHQDVPFEKLVQELAPERSLAQTPLFQVMLALQNAPAASLEIEDLRLRPVSRAGTTAKFDLELTLEERSGGLFGTVEHATDLFDAVTIDRLVLHYERLLTAALATPEAAISELALLSPAEHHQVLAEWNDTAVPPPESLLPGLFAAQVARTPGALAAACEGESVTYAQLGARVERLARHLRTLGCGPESRVGVALERNLELLVALLGVLTAGAVYVPLDPEYPRERLAWLLADSRPAALLTQESLRDRLPIPEGLPVVVPAALPEAAPGLDPRAPEVLGGELLAYIIYTSGSTGRPKGAMVAHAGMINHLRAKIEDLGLDGHSRVAQTASQCFDISVWQLLAPLLTGGSVHFAGEAAVHDPALLLRFAARERITVLEVVPSLLSGLLESLAAAGGALDLSFLQWMIVTGEACAPDLAHRWLEIAPHTRLLNAYGPTECSDDVTHFESLRRGSGPPLCLPVGRPVANTRIHVLDPAGQPLPPGVPGELCVGGRGVGRGYWGLPARTAQVFVPDAWSEEPGSRLYRTGDLARWLADGTLELLGRIDHQVKVRGFRIELGEIEALLAALAGVREAAVLLRDDTPGGPQLVAYVAGVAGADALRTALRERLPEYMVPAAFVTLPALPLTPNGKVDRKALPAPVWQSSGDRYQAPRTPVEEALAGIWAELLGRERVGAADNFFGLGGHSLLATRVVSRIRSAFQVEIPVRSLFDEPTLADLAALVERALRSGGGMEPSISRVPRSDPLPLSFAQQQLWVLDQMLPGRADYNIHFAVRLDGALDIPALAATLSEIAGRHEALRTVFRLADGEPVQEVRPKAAAPLPLADLSTLPPALRRSEARRLALADARTPFDLGRGPLLRAALLRLDAREHLALLTLHHIVSDGWSTGILVREIGALYPALARGERPGLPELPVQYADFAAWQRRWLSGDRLESQLRYWQRQLADLPVLHLPTDRPRPPVQTFRGRRRQLAIPAGVAQRLRGLATEERTSLFVPLLAGLAAVLHQISGQDDIPIGTDVANRTRQEVEGLIGFFVNQLVMRVDLAGDPTFRELLRRTREMALAAWTHQDIPFERLVATLQSDRDPSRSPLFQVKLVLQNAPAEALRLPGLTLGLLPLDTGSAKHDLLLNLADGEAGIGGTLEHNTDLFDEATMERWLDRFRRLLEYAAERPDDRLSEALAALAAEAGEGRLRIGRAGRRPVRGVEVG